MTPPASINRRTVLFARRLEILTDALAVIIADVAPDGWAQAAQTHLCQWSQRIRAFDIFQRKPPAGRVALSGRVGRGDSWQDSGRRSASALCRTVTAIARAGKEVSPVETQEIADAGGARAKANVRDGDRRWPAKFPLRTTSRPLSVSRPRPCAWQRPAASALPRYGRSCRTRSFPLRSSSRMGSLPLRTHPGAQASGVELGSYIEIVECMRSCSSDPSDIPQAPFVSDLHHPRIQTMTIT